MSRILISCSLLWTFALLGNDREALLAAITAHPDEDTPRLAYADWLDEHGTSEADRAHAELIRLQIKIYRARTTSTDHILGSLRSNSLLSQYAKKWMPDGLGLRWTVKDAIPFPLPHDVHVNQAIWRRGFVEGVTLGETMRASELTALEHLPALDSMTLSVGVFTDKQHADPMIAHAGEALARVRKFHLNAVATGGSTFLRLLSHLSRVEHVHFNPATMTSDEFDEVLYSDAARRLKTLSLATSGDRFSTVLGNTTMRNVETLMVGPFDQGDMSKWREGSLPALKSLVVRAATEPMLEALVGNARFKTLSRLSITPRGPVHLNDEMLNAIATQGTSLTHLEVLDAAGNPQPLPSAIEDRLKANGAKLACAALTEQMGGD